MRGLFTTVVGLALTSLVAHSALVPGAPSTTEKTPNSVDRKLARFIDNIERRLRINRTIKTGHFPSLDLLSKSKIFRSEIPLIQQIRKIVGASRKHTAKACSEMLDIDTTSATSQILAKRAWQRCAYLILNKHAYPTANYWPLKERLLKVAIKRPRMVKNLLKELKADPAQLRLLSLDLTRFMVDQDIVWPRDILDNMYIDGLATSHINRHDIYAGDVEKMLYQQFRKQYYSIKKLIETPTNNISLNTQFYTFTNFVRLNFHRMPNEKVRKSLVYMTKLLVRGGREQKGQQLVSLLEQSSSNEHRDDIIFLGAWSSMAGGDVEGARQYFQRHRVYEGYQNFGPTIRFWSAQALQESSRKKMRLLESIIQDHPLSYYAAVAYEQLTRDEHIIAPATKRFEKLIQGNINIRAKIFDQGTQHAINRIQIWSALDAKRFLRKEISVLKDRIPVDAYQEGPEKVMAQVAFEIASRLNETKNHLEAFRFVHRAVQYWGLAVDRQVLSILYPRPYHKRVRKIASQDIDDHLILSLIRQESAFNPMARSRVGARGLMQLMPRTAKGMRPGVKVQQLNNPKTNLALGTRYLGKLWDTFDQNIIFSLAAYNAGPHRVRKWKRDNLLSAGDHLKNIEQIPFSETRSYVKLILRNLFFYEKLYRNASSIPELEELVDSL